MSSDREQTGITGTQVQRVFDYYWRHLSRVLLISSIYSDFPIIDITFDFRQIIIT